jgi:hypothetical protein
MSVSGRVLAQVSLLATRSFRLFSPNVLPVGSGRFTADYRSSSDSPGRHLWFDRGFSPSIEVLRIPRSGFGRCTHGTEAVFLEARVACDVDGWEYDGGVG